MNTPSHQRDEDCDVGPDGICLDCGVGHGADPCPDCGKRAFHLADCPQMISARWLETDSPEEIAPLVGRASAAAAVCMTLAANAGFHFAREFLVALRAAEGEQAGDLPV